MPSSTSFTVPTDWSTEQGEIDRRRACGLPGAVLSDVRFDNEAEFILARGGVLWGISRPVRAIDVRRHASEAGISTSYASRGIVNAAGFPSLYARVDNLIEQLEARAPGAAA